jgi:hypothetical protein
MIVHNGKIVQVCYRDDAVAPPTANKFNQNHDERGRFTTGDGATSGMFARAIKDGGFTIASDGSEPSSGYSVGGYGPSLTIPDTLGPADGDKAIAAWQQDNADLLAQDGMHTGGWHDTADGTVVMDATRVYSADQRDAAIADGQTRNQIAIFDIGANEEISTGGTGE